MARPYDKNAAYAASLRHIDLGVDGDLIDASYAKHDGRFLVQRTW